MFAERSPSSYAVETWFKTTSTQGGRVVGFGDAAQPVSSVTSDRHLYMTNDDRLVFGVRTPSIQTLTSPTGALTLDRGHGVGSVMPLP